MAGIGEMGRGIVDAAKEIQKTLAIILLVNLATPQVLAEEIKDTRTCLQKAISPAEKEALIMINPSQSSVEQALSLLNIKINKFQSLNKEWSKLTQEYNFLNTLKNEKLDTYKLNLKNKIYYIYGKIQLLFIETSSINKCLNPNTNRPQK